MFRIAMLLILATSCSQLNRKAGLSDDNLVEEMIEQALEHRTGLDIDFTPATAEAK